VACGSLAPNSYDLWDRIRCSDHRLCNHCQGILKLAQKNSLFLKSSISTDHCTVNANMFQSHSKKIPFVLPLLRLALHKQFKFKLPPNFLWFATYVLTAVLTLYFKLVPDSSDLLPEDSQLGAKRRKQCRGTWCYSPRPLWHSISSCSQDCAIHATSSFSPAASTHIVIVATKLQRSLWTWSCLTRHCWLIWRCFKSKKQCLVCWMERSLWTARIPVS
jgi:hypothetical protein